MTRDVMGAETQQAKRAAEQTLHACVGVFVSAKIAEVSWLPATEPVTKLNELHGA